MSSDHLQGYGTLYKQNSQNVNIFFFLEKKERNKTLTQVFSSRRNNFSMVQRTHKLHHGESFCFHSFG